MQKSLRYRGVLFYCFDGGNPDGVQRCKGFTVEGEHCIVGDLGADEARQDGYRGKLLHVGEDCKRENENRELPEFVRQNKTRGFLKKHVASTKYI